VLVLTTQSGRVPFVGSIIALLGSTTITATLGHGALFAILTGVSYVVLTGFLPRLPALLAAIALALAAGTLTELSQILLVDRDASLSDLLANWLGVFVAAFGIAFVRLYRTTVRHAFAD
jgi:VanZ family protein